MIRRAFARPSGASVGMEGSNGLMPSRALRSPARYRIPFADPPMVASSCFWMLVIASGRTITQGTFDTTRMPDAVSVRRTEARNLFASSGGRSDARFVRSMMEAELRVGMPRTFPSLRSEGQPRCGRNPIEGFLLVALPDNVPPFWGPTPSYARSVLDDTDA